jgi:hypothetical protein
MQQSRTAIPNINLRGELSMKKKKQQPVGFYVRISAFHVTCTLDRSMILEGPPGGKAEA